MYPAAYPILLLTALVVGGYLLRRNQTTLTLEPEQRIGIGIAAFCGAMVGAKLPFLLWDWEGLMSGMAWLSNGKTIMCGIVGAYFSVEVAKWLLNIRTKTGDSFAVPVAAAVAIGRLGCFAAGCCYGVPTNLPWAITFPTVDAIARHPTQIYESLFHASMALLLYVLQKRRVLQGQLVKLYIIAYLLYRLLTEFIRPEAEFWLGLTSYQWFAIVLIPVFLGLWIVDLRKAPRTLDQTTDPQTPETAQKPI